MVYLVIHAPKYTSESETKWTFDGTFASGVGNGYAIPRKEFEQCAPGCGVILLSKDEEKRAEGVLVKLVPTEKAGNGWQRYDVHMQALRRVAYRPEKLKRSGIAVIVRD